MTGTKMLRGLAQTMEDLSVQLLDITGRIERELARQGEPDSTDNGAHLLYVTEEDRDALAWVREYGGIEGVSRLFQDADSRRVELCGALGIDLDKGWSEAMAAMRLRLMPEGCKWPRYESGDLVMFGDCVENRNGTCAVNSVRFYSGGGVSVYGEDRGAQFVVVTEPVMRDPIRKARPKVFAADGEPLEAGQTVWDVLGNRRFKVLGFGSDPKLGEFTVKTVGIDGMSLEGYSKPSDLTHQRPVLDADGVPIREGDTVWLIGGGEAAEVAYTIEADASHPDEVVLKGYEDDWPVNADKITHAKPEPVDTWQCIEEDALLPAGDYRERYGMEKRDGMTWQQQIREDLVRRCRALAERERGE